MKYLNALMLLFMGLLVPLFVHAQDSTKDAGKSNHLKSFEELAETLNGAKPDRLFLSEVIAKIETIKPGMTRKDLGPLLEGDGGISTRTHRKYIYRKFPVIKVEIEFRNIGESEDSRDIITKISKPFLEYPIVD